MSEGIIGWPVFSLWLSAELVQPTVHEYRKKQQHLENLEFTAVHAHLLNHPEYSKVSVFCHEKLRLSKLMIPSVNASQFILAYGIQKKLRSLLRIPYLSTASQI
jgi:hypothetical protein